MARQKLVGGKSKSDNFMKLSVPAQILSFLLKNTCMPILSRFSKKYRHISKTRVFEKRFSQLHCVMFCLFTVKKFVKYEPHDVLQK